MGGAPLAAGVLLTLFLAGSRAQADVEAPHSRLTIDQRAGALRSPQGEWRPSLLQTAVELEARWPRFGIALRLVDYQLAFRDQRVIGGSVGARLPVLRRGRHEVVLGVDVGGATSREPMDWLFWNTRPDADKGLALTGALRWTSPVSEHLSLGANVRYGGLPRTGVQWLSVGFVMTAELGTRRGP